MNASQSLHQFFVYDTELPLSEFDDPVSAVVYSDPRDTRPEVKLAVAGTLTGVANFFERVLDDEARPFLELLYIQLLLLMHIILLLAYY